MGQSYGGGNSIFWVHEKTPFSQKSKSLILALARTPSQNLLHRVAAVSFLVGPGVNIGTIQCWVNETGQRIPIQLSTPSSPKDSVW